MWAAILAFLKQMAEKAGEAAFKGGKLAAKGATELVKQTQAGKLYNAFSGMLSKSDKTAEAGSMGKTSITPTSNIASQQQPPIIPSQYQDFVRQPSMQYAPGPEGSVLGGQGETMPGYGMQTPQSRIPPQYLNMAQAGQQPQTTNKYPGVLAGLKEGFLGMPSSAMDREPGIGELGVNTTGEEARQQQMLEAYGNKKVTPEYKKDLQEATTRLANPNLSETDKVMIYQQLVTVYPERSAEIRRIFFPQSQDNSSDLLSQLILSQGGFNAR
jgi:hypothetical protein